MREYELIYIVQPDLDEATLTSVIERIETLVKDAQGEIVKTDIWGKRKLAYPIRKLNEGFYVFSKINVDPASVININRSIKFIEQVIRFSVLLSE